MNNNDIDNMDITTTTNNNNNNMDDNNESDSTEEEVLVLLNFPEFNYDENKMKLLNLVRDKKADVGENIIDEEGDLVDLEQDQEQEKHEKYFWSNEDLSNKKGIATENTLEDNLELKEEEIGTCSLLNINNIMLKGLFSEEPKCIINEKYEFKGTQTSSIGTNFFFKEPNILKIKRESKDDKNKDNIENNGTSIYDKSIDPLNNKDIKNDNKITIDDFATHEGHSTKMISFEINY